MKILLLQPPIEDFYTTAIRLYPLGLLYTAAVLRAAGHQVRIIDALTPLKRRTLALPLDFDHLRPFLGKTPYFFSHYYRFGREDETLLAEIKAWRPDAIGISSQFTAYYKNVHEVATRIRAETGCMVFIGGHHATAFAAECLERTPALDAVCTGPAETGLQHVFDHAGKPLVQGAMDWQEVTPAHDLLEAEGYRIGHSRYASLQCSRGCPHGCDFCGVEKMFGRKMSYRPVEAVLDEMRYLYDQHQVRIFNFEDDNLTIRREWFQEFLHQVAANPNFAEIELTAMNGVCYPTLDEETLRLMRAAGFKRLNLSYVTRDPALRSDYHRPRAGEQIEQVIARARHLGLFVTVYLIIGLPGQTYQEIWETIEHLLNLGVLVGPSIFYIPPASALYEQLNLPAAILDDWNLYRSSAFAVETEQLSRAQLFELFSYVRQENLARLPDGMQRK